MPKPERRSHMKAKFILESILVLIICLVLQILDWNPFEPETMDWRAIINVDQNVNTTHGFDAMKVIVRVSD